VQSREQGRWQEEAAGAAKAGSGYRRQGSSGFSLPSLLRRLHFPPSLQASLQRIPVEIRRRCYAFVGNAGCLRLFLFKPRRHFSFLFFSFFRHRYGVVCDRCYYHALLLRLPPPSSPPITAPLSSPLPFLLHCFLGRGRGEGSRCLAQVARGWLPLPHAYHGYAMPCFARRHADIIIPPCYVLAAAAPCSLQLQARAGGCHAPPIHVDAAMLTRATLLSAMLF